VSDTVHKIVTERIIAALERGTVPWRKPWQAAGQPRSMSTGQSYRGVNMFLLGMTADEQGYESPFWGTYRQIGALGGQVRMGERSALAVFWKKAEIADRDPLTGETTLKQLPVLRYYRVFNAAQADHLPARFFPQPGEHGEIKEPQALLDVYLARGPQLQHTAGDRAAYNPATDTIRLPLRSQFRTPEGYYVTAFHEAGHSTGHPARLNRPGIADFDHFGSDRYAREELVAQMTSSILCAQAGIDTPETFDNSASYIAGWLSALKGDTRLVVTAAAQAQRACDLITQAEREAAPGNEQEATLPAVGTIADARSNAARADPRPAARRLGEPTAAAREHSVRVGLQHAHAGPGSQHPARAVAPSAFAAADITPGREHGFRHGSPEAPLQSGGNARHVEKVRTAKRASGWQAEAE
jgi:antirestriction protein ArdC